MDLILILVYLLCIHCFLINPLEKLTVQSLFDGNHMNMRPSVKCADESMTSVSLGCLGMPSGHAEIATIICVLLVLKSVIIWPYAVCFIILICFQRIVTNRHTLNQVIVGVMLGIAYAILYYLTFGDPFMIVVLTLAFIVLYVTLIITYMKEMKVSDDLENRILKVFNVIMDYDEKLV